MEMSRLIELIGCNFRNPPYPTHSAQSHLSVSLLITDERERQRIQGGPEIMMAAVYNFSMKMK